MGTSYWHFLKNNRHLLSFGFLGTFFSGFGQTYFIALYSGHLREAFELTHGQLSLYYSLATLISGISLMWLGRIIDHVPLRLYVFGVCFGLATACWLMASAHSILLLVISLFLLRLNGQGLISHASITTMARYFHHARGKALSLATMGFAFAEGIFPTLAVALIATSGWRGSWMLYGFFVTLVVTPLLLWLLQHQSLDRPKPDSPPSQRPTSRQWSTREVARDPVFLMVVPAATATPAIITGLFFHHLFIAQQNQWSAELIATGFVIFALTHIFALAIMGPTVDRLGAPRLVPFFLLPLGLGVALLGIFDQSVIFLIYMALTGITLGSSSTVINSLWAEIYGVTFIGSIRALNQGIMVVSTAIAPLLVGIAIDGGATVANIALTVTIYMALCIALALRACRSIRHRKRAQEYA